MTPEQLVAFYERRIPRLVDEVAHHEQQATKTRQVIEVAQERLDQARADLAKEESHE